jgi:hypothetical protein
VDLADALGELKRLRVLDVGANGIGEVGGCALAEASLRSLSIETLCMSGNSLGAMTAEGLASLMVHPSTCLRTLVLSGNHSVGDKGGVLLARAVPSAPRLVTLDVSGCGLTTTTVAAAAEALSLARGGSEFATLLIGDNRIGRPALATLRAILASRGGQVLSDAWSGEREDEGGGEEGDGAGKPPDGRDDDGEGSRSPVAPQSPPPVRPPSPMLLAQEDHGAGTPKSQVVLQLGGGVKPVLLVSGKAAGVQQLERAESHPPQRVMFDYEVQAAERHHAPPAPTPQQQQHQQQQYQGVRSQFQELLSQSRNAKMSASTSRPAFVPGGAGKRTARRVVVQAPPRGRDPASLSRSNDNDSSGGGEAATKIAELTRLLNSSNREIGRLRALVSGGGGGGAAGSPAVAAAPKAPAASASGSPPAQTPGPAPHTPHSHSLDDRGAVSRRLTRLQSAVNKLAEGAAERERASAEKVEALSKEQTNLWEGFSGLMEVVSAGTAGVQSAQALAEPLSAAQRKIEILEAEVASLRRFTHNLARLVDRQENDLAALRAERAPASSAISASEINMVIPPAKTIAGNVHVAGSSESGTSHRSVDGTFDNAQGIATTSFLSPGSSPRWIGE